MNILTYHERTLPKEIKQNIQKIKYRTHKIEGLLPTFPCDLCGRDFIGRNKLNEHMKTHTGEATCDLCNKVFYSVSSMKKHRERLSCQRFDGHERKIVKSKVSNTLFRI